MYPAKPPGVDARGLFPPIGFPMLPTGQYPGLQGYNNDCNGSPYARYWTEIRIWETEQDIGLETRLMTAQRHINGLGI